MQNDRKIIITTGASRKAMVWNQQALMWSELVDKLRSPTRSTEPFATYISLPKSKQDDLKDVGGFVAGTLDGQRRKADAVTGRDVITLDLDNVPPAGTVGLLQLIESLGCAYAVYSTRKHEESHPRLRVLIPTDRTVSADEYEPVARKMAGFIGIQMCDPSTFEPSRLMYWPSCSADSQYIYTFGDKPFLSADGVLSMYADWHNVTEWPEVPGVQQSHVKLAAKQGDPTAKSGVVGAFCKTYNIYSAMEKFLPDAYTPCDFEGRYTFSGGSTTGGAVIYDNGNFLFSHHATDPAGGKLCNSFDLVRLHMFGDLDEDAKPDTPTNKLASYVAMCQFAVEDTTVASLLNTERYDRATQEFSAPVEDTANWINKLRISPTTGVPQKTISNVLVILDNDPLLKNRLLFDEFSNRVLAVGPLPWDSTPGHRNWTDNDDAGMRNYIEKAYAISGKDRIMDACSLCCHQHSFNEVQEFIRALPQWDGFHRLDTLLTDYLGATDNEYTRAVSRKSFVAAVARAMTPGVKYDTMPILSGPQGIGKSTFLHILGGKWFSDSLTTFEGKEACEMIQGSWILEMGELNGLSRSETNAVKQFLSKTDDIYRVPYGRRTDTYPRRCVFFGTTNDSEFLKDGTGGRRFWPVDVGINPMSKSVFKDLAIEAPQIWAEAVAYWQIGEPLFMSGSVAKRAMDEQELHQENNAKEGIIREFVERPIPADWQKRTLEQRRVYWSGEFGRSQCEAGERDRICALEVWCECLGGDIKFLRQADAREINAILEKMKGWKHNPSQMRFGYCGQQRGFSRV